jgi:hypothetical protein
VAPLRPRERRRAVLLAAALVGMVAVALAKPWGSPPSPARVAIAPAPALARTPAASAPPAPTADAPPGWPAQASLRLSSADPTSTAAAARLLAAHAGRWGVGDGGSGPRLIRDAVWTDWVPLSPGPPAASPDALSNALGSGTCRGLPLLADLPAVVAVTAPSSVGSGWRLSGWWSDGHGMLSLAGSVREVSLPGAHGVGELERRDLTLWPAGRYELHLTSGGRTYGLSMCVGIPG